MKEPLNLPRGSVRAILAVMIVGACVASVFLPVANENALNALLVVGALVAKDYFDTRRVQNEQDGPVLPEPYVGK